MDKLKAGWAKLAVKWAALDKKTRKYVVIGSIFVGLVILAVLAGDA